MQEKTFLSLFCISFLFFPFLLLLFFFYVCCSLTVLFFLILFLAVAHFFLYSSEYVSLPLLFLFLFFFLLLARFVSFLFGLSLQLFVTVILFFSSILSSIFCSFPFNVSYSDLHLLFYILDQIYWGPFFVVSRFKQFFSFQGGRSSRVV